MTIKEFAELHKLLAKLKYLLVQDMFKEISSEYSKSLKNNIKAIDTITKIVVIDNEVV